MSLEKFDKTILELKRRTTVGKEFSWIMDYFLSNLGENQEFIQAGSTEILDTELDLYKAMLTPVREHCGPSITLDDLLLLKYPRWQFVHGAVRLSNGYFGMLYFYEDILMGFISIGNSLQLMGKGNVNFFRLTGFARPVTEKPDTIFAPLVSKNLH